LFAGLVRFTVGGVSTRMITRFDTAIEPPLSIAVAIRM